MRRSGNGNEATGEGSGEASGGIQSLDAALRVLLAMGRLEGPVGLTELARACDMPVPKVHRYLASFLHAGLVRQTGRSGKYDLGTAAIELGLAALHRHDFVNWAADDLASLAADTGLTALLVVWGNSGPTVVRWERATTFIVTALGLGTTMPLLSSASGRIFLAYLPETVLAAQLRRELRRVQGRPELVPDMTPDAKGAKALAGQVRTAGHATVDGRYIPGLVAAAAPILDWQGQAQAAVTLIGTNPEDIADGSPVVDALTAFCRRHSVDRAP